MDHGGSSPFYLYSDSDKSHGIQDFFCDFCRENVFSLFQSQFVVGGVQSEDGRPAEIAEGFVFA
ncbi:MAG: hypothetical protein K2P43_10230, partial [Lachnospiraceae bacterium]|nr:hypothetical protein [Lachnospiraceae bacterium]